MMSNRRDFLKLAASFASYTILNHLILDAMFAMNAFGQAIPLKSLSDSLNPNDAMILVASHKDFSRYQVSFNKRYSMTPTVRVLCKTPQAVSTCVQWAKQNGILLAMRGGGHSYEGLSQTTGIVIDTRLMSQLDIHSNSSQFTVGAGAQLGEIYGALSQNKVIIAAGSCPSVGIAGHVTGGGYGLLSRSFGLACDQLVSAQMVSADGRILDLSKDSNAELFWAIRGGGGGSFGVMTQFEFKTSPMDQVLTYIFSWSVNKDIATLVLSAWQQLAPKMSSNINGLIKVLKDSKGVYQIRCVGQSIGSKAELKTAFAPLFNLKSPKTSYENMKFMDAVQKFSGQAKPDMIPVYMKAKSDYVKHQALTPADMNEFLLRMPANVAAIFDCYGGKIAEKKNSDTAFAHRDNTLCSIQYYMEWSDHTRNAEYLARIKNFYDSVRPLFPDPAAYVNYCDLDLNNYPEAYWGDNLVELQRIKTDYDPMNVFSHLQSIPVLK